MSTLVAAGVLLAVRLDAGASLHFALIGERDVNRALTLCRTVNLRVVHQNGQRREKYQRALVRYEAKLAAWHARPDTRAASPCRAYLAGHRSDDGRWRCLGARTSRPRHAAGHRAG